jgi:hypothetical protein
MFAKDALECVHLMLMTLRLPKVTDPVPSDNRAPEFGNIRRSVMGVTKSAYCGVFVDKQQIGGVNVAPARTSFRSLDARPSLPILPKVGARLSATESVAPFKAGMPELPFGGALARLRRGLVPPRCRPL